MQQRQTSQINSNDSIDSIDSNDLNDVVAFYNTIRGVIGNLRTSDKPFNIKLRTNLAGMKFSAGITPEQVAALPDNVKTITFTHDFFEDTTPERFQELMEKLPKTVKWIQFDDHCPNRDNYLRVSPHHVTIYKDISKSSLVTDNLLERYEILKRRTVDYPEKTSESDVPRPKRKFEQKPVPQFYGQPSSTPPVYQPSAYFSQPSTTDYQQGQHFPQPSSTPPVQPSPYFRQPSRTDYQPRPLYSQQTMMGYQELNYSHHRSQNADVREELEQERRKTARLKQELEMSRSLNAKGAIDLLKLQNDLANMQQELENEQHRFKMLESAVRQGIDKHQELKAKKRELKAKKQELQGIVHFGRSTCKFYDDQGRSLNSKKRKIQPGQDDGKFMKHDK